MRQAATAPLAPSRTRSGASSSQAAAACRLLQREPLLPFPTIAASVGAAGAESSAGGRALLADTTSPCRELGGGEEGVQCVDLLEVLGASIHWEGERKEESGQGGGGFSIHREFGTFCNGTS